MLKYVGEVLPYANFKESTLGFTYDYDYDIDYETYTIDVYYYWVIYDDSANVAFSDDYGDKLEEAGWEYDSDLEGYTKTNARGYDLELYYDFYPETDDYSAGNQIYISLSDAYQDPITPDSLVADGYAPVDGWPTATVNETLGDDSILTGANLDGVWYQKRIMHDSGNGKGYFIHNLASQGKYAAELASQLLEAGYEYDEDYDCYYDEVTTCEIYLADKFDNFTTVRILGPNVDLPDYTEEEIMALDEAMVKWNAYPAELMEDIFGGEIIEGVNLTDPWYGVSEKKSGKTSDDKDVYQYTATLYTAGDVRNDLDAQFKAAGFFTKAGANSTEYSKEFTKNDYAKVTVSFLRGYTKIVITGPYVYPNGDGPQPDPSYSLADLDQYLAAFFAAGGANLEMPEYVAADVNAYFKDTSTETQFELRIYGSSTYSSAKDNMAEIHAFANAFEDVNPAWTVSIDSYGDCTLSLPEYGAEMTFYGMSAYFRIRASIDLPEPPAEVTAADASAGAEEFFAGKGLDVDVPEYAAAAENASFVTSSANGVYEIDVFNSNGDELDAFAYALYQAEWTVVSGDYEGEYIAINGKAVIELQNWNEEEGYGCIRLICHLIDANATAHYFADIMGYFFNQDDQGNYEPLSISDYSADAGYPYFQIDASFPKAAFGDESAADILKPYAGYIQPDGFGLLQNWTAGQFQDGTPKETCYYGLSDYSVISGVTLYEFEYQGTTYVVFSAFVYDN